MPIWGQVELLCRAVSEEGRKEAELILAQAQAEAARIIAEARERAEKERESELLAQTSAAYAEAKHIVDSAELEARKRIMTFREQVIQEILEALQVRLKEFRKEPGYGDFLMSALREGIEHLPGEAFIVELNAQDLELVAEKARDWAQHQSLAVELKPSASIDAGLRVTTEDQRLLYDNSLSARLKRNENDIRQQIWRTIFGTESKPG
jgi:V/A-type H+/Na+-transporting ATPase subunit E